MARRHAHALWCGAGWTMTADARPWVQPRRACGGSQPLRGWVCEEQRAVMSLDLDMIVETDLALVQFRIKVRFDWQRLERGALDLIKQRTPASSQVSHHSRAMRGVSGVAKLSLRISNTRWRMS